MPLAPPMLDLPPTGPLPPAPLAPPAVALPPVGELPPVLLAPPVLDMLPTADTPPVGAPPTAELPPAPSSLLVLVLLLPPRATVLLPLPPALVSPPAPFEAPAAPPDGWSLTAAVPLPPQAHAIANDRLANKFRSRMVPPLPQVASGKWISHMESQPDFPQGAGSSVPQFSYPVYLQ